MLMIARILVLMSTSPDPMTAVLRWQQYSMPGAQSTAMLGQMLETAGARVAMEGAN